MLTIYAYANCSTCRKAISHVKQLGVAYAEIPIREQPPTAAQLTKLLAAVGGDIRRLFNTSGLEYRTGGWSDRLADMSDADAIAALAANGNLCKRPMVLGPKTALVGFKPAEWTAAGL